MEAPLKRKRLSLSPGAEDETSDVDLHEARAQNDMRLKSVFEGIFKKYGRDFTDIGDEIDLQTGNIMVNNGHLHALDGEDDAGAIENWLPDTDSQAPSNEEAEGTGDGTEARLHTQRAEESGREGNGDHSGRRVISILSQMRPDPERSREIVDGDGDGDGTTSEAEDDRSSVDSLLNTALSVQGTRTREVGKGEAVTEKAIPQPEGSNQSQAAHTERLDETVDPVWRVPEINAKFTTPTQLRRSRPKPRVKTVRSQSPPGAGSVWALPWTTRRKTDVARGRKQKNSPKKRKKHQSSPIVCDWSFADTPDGSESDDPLQEDYEPSPTPKGSVYIREKRKNPFSGSGTKSTCSCCKKTFSQEGYISHLRTVLSNPADNEHDLREIKRQLGTATGDGATGPARGATTSVEPIARPTNTPTLKHGSKEDQGTNHESTPTGKRAKTVLGPEEARLIIQMKQVQGMKWKEILDHFPQKKLSNLQAWHHFHWNHRKAFPPRLSGPWSKAELERLEILKDQPDLTWPGIRAQLPGRLLAEVEFKLLQLWAGDSVSQEHPPSEHVSGGG
ncbi:hypothetical protein BDW62DRAFT_102686 [Aspergillus aurantiobrunneus]